MGPAISFLWTLSNRSSFYASDSRTHESLLSCLEKPPEKRTIRVISLLGHNLYRRLVKLTLVVLATLGLFFLFGPDVSVPGVVQLNRLHLAQTHDLPPPQSPSLGPLPPRPDGPPEVDVEQIADAAVVLQDQPGAAGRVPDEHGKTPNHGLYMGQPQAASGGPSDEHDAGSESKNGQVGGDGPPDERVQGYSEESRKKMPWLNFRLLDGYFHGLKTLVNLADLEPEYPNRTLQIPLPAPPLNRRVRKPRPYNPYGDSSNMRTCYLDRDNKIAAPAMYAYHGVPQHMPDPVVGSYHLFGIRDDVCFDRFARYGPYGLGYSKLRGGAGIGAETEGSGSEQVWAATGQIDFNKVDWGRAQKRCHAANRHRFADEGTASRSPPASSKKRGGKKSRMAVVVRCYQGFRWTELAVLNLRAMVTELSLRSGGEYTVHLLLHVHDVEAPIWVEELAVRQLLDSHVPAEFHSLVTLWSEPQMRLYYPGNFGDTLENASGGDLHGVYRSAHMPLQVFAKQHPEYEQIWNWEMDMRCLGNYYELFDRIGRWAEAQPRRLLWERNARYYIPSHHGTWDGFAAAVERQVEESGELPVSGPTAFKGRKPLLRDEGPGTRPVPQDCAEGGDGDECGVGEAADIITLNPIFDPHLSGWVFSDDVTGYEEASPAVPPRRCAIVTAGRLSRRLLLAMDEETWRQRHTMFSEMFPPTVALHHGLKAVYAPHPTLFDRAWQPLGSALDAALNSGQHHSTSGLNSPYGLDNEHNHKGGTWYYHSEFAGRLWRRWLGYAQKDGPEDRGVARGGVVEESAPESSGRMCLRSMLLHPIKHEHPSEVLG